jgi:signal transduction histidine kinase
MVSTILDVEEGNMGARTGPVESGDEIGKVANHLDELLDLLQERDLQLRNLAQELNKRVEERTAELQAANKQLEATTQQLVISEKLAAIGEITAGVAHEINNPVAVIQGNMDVIREVLGDETDQVITEFRLIDEQVHSINLIVSKLLQFARPEEFAGYHDQHMVDDVMTDCLLLVQHLLNKTLIKVERDSNSVNPVLINRTEFQQVLINLIVNAIHSMEDGGTLTLKNCDKFHDEKNGVQIEITDTGKGMAPDVLKRAFDPFFTTKQSEGTGLGLSISQTLISRMGGEIKVESKVGKGTTFSIWLPAIVEDEPLSIIS